MVDMAAVIDLTGASSDEEEATKPSIEKLMHQWVQGALRKPASNEWKSNEPVTTSSSAPATSVSAPMTISVAAGGGSAAEIPERRANGGALTPSQSGGSSSSLTRVSPQNWNGNISQARSSSVAEVEVVRPQGNAMPRAGKAIMVEEPSASDNTVPRPLRIVSKVEAMTEGEFSSSSRVPVWGQPLPPDVPESPRPPQAAVVNLPNVPPVNEIYRGRPRAIPYTNGASSSAGVCRNFWRAGDYEAQQSARNASRGAMDHVRVHPKFLHSNATSHKWALGAIAELLDNAVDEIQNGATFVNIDVIVNPRDGSPVLLVQDDGGGMSADCMRQCMSLGYSAKNTLTTIGQYGNGFKTSTMRLGADVIVFSRCSKESSLSIGLLSYTFLRKTGMEDVVVPMVDFDVAFGQSLQDAPPKPMIRTNEADWQANMDILTQWSPFSSEEKLLSQFHDIGLHGTKVIVYNLWMNDDGILELDFITEENDIMLRGGPPKASSPTQLAKPVQQQLAENHIANRYHHSLRIYTSILYMKMPRGFQIILRGQPVEHHLIASDLKFCEHIVYKPQIGISQPGGPRVQETQVITVIGFTKEAPLVPVHGFCVYHKNRLIMPFWKVWQDNSSRGRGVVGVLEANFVEPAHDKQDFERTAVLLRLESRLKGMTVEYWNLHCHLIGYQPNTKAGKARRAAQAEVPLSLPSPIASIAPGGSPSGIGEAGGEDLIPGTPGFDADGRVVKAEPVDGSTPSFQRPGAKRARVENTENALVVRQNSEEFPNLELVRENSQLKAKCQFFEAQWHDLVNRNHRTESRCQELVDKHQSSEVGRREAESLANSLAERVAELETLLKSNGGSVVDPGAGKQEAKRLALRVAELERLLQMHGANVVDPGDEMDEDNNGSGSGTSPAEPVRQNGRPKLAIRLAKLEP